MATNTTTKISTHEKFNAADADVIIQSSDGVQFHLHRKYLEAYTGAFPGVESAALIRSDGQGDVVHLTEPAEVLEILFEFVFPRRPPDLKDLEFTILMRLAEAVEKYEVFAAMRLCEVRLKRFIPDGPMEILMHGIRHEYPLLINEAALQLSRARMSLGDILEKLPAETQMPWVRYHEAWRAIFALQSNSGLLCVKCKGPTMAWVSDSLEKKETMDDLRSELRIGPPAVEDIIYMCEDFSRISDPRCVSSGIAAKLEAAINSIPPFTDFLTDIHAAKDAAQIARETALKS